MTGSPEPSDRGCARTGARLAAVSERHHTHLHAVLILSQTIADRKWTLGLVSSISWRRQLAHMHFRRHRKAIVRILLALFILFNTLDILHVRQRFARGSASAESYTPGSERVFVASIFWNNEAILRSSLSATLVALVETLGPKNVFISIHESGSWNGSAPREELPRPT
jgi:hypothetical protein